MTEKQILVVEDEVIIAENLRKKLSALGYKVPAVVVSGEEAVQKVEEMRPDLVLMDIKLKGKMDGVEAARQIRARFDIPVVYLTALTDETTLKRAKITEPFGYILKPFEARELPITVEMALYKYEMDKKLKESEERYRTISELTSDYATSIRVERDGTLVVEWIAGAFTRITGFTLELNLPDDLDKLVHPDDLSVALDHLQICLSGQTHEAEYRIVSKSGQVCWVHDYGRPVWDEALSRVVRIYGATQDITERKRVAEQLQCYAAELELANEEVRQFAYIVSHDLRAPLINLKGFAAELRSALQVTGSVINADVPFLDEEQLQAVTTALHQDAPEALDFIESSVTRMDSFVNALLKLSRLGRRELDLESVDMNALVQAILHSLAHQLEERQVKVSVGSLPTVVADRISMEQIMSNLLSNAVLYLDPSRPGEIEIIAEHDGDETTSFHVRDNGRGIAEKDMSKVFAPFRRGGRQDVPGEGMGLSYVQALVRRHGGRIWCESEPGVGTTFTFTLSNRLTQGADHA
jgi:PAS domain S-box-containing protein